MTFEEMCARRDELVFNARLAAQRLAIEKAALAEAQQEEAAREEARDILQTTGQEIQQQAHDRIADVVTRCLQAVFGMDYRFSIIFERKRGRTEARMVFLKKDKEIDPLFSSGGGVIDVAAFALRVACLMMTKPPLRRVLFLDEPMRHLSRDLLPRVASLIESLSKELGVQFLIVTHSEAFKIGTVVEIK